jgi:hypothetical protein
VTGQWFSPGTPVSSTNKTDLHDITEILLKVALNTIDLNLNLNLKRREKNGDYYIISLSIFMYYWRMAILMLKHSLINEGNIGNIVVDLVLHLLDQTSGKLTEETYHVHLQLFLIMHYFDGVGADLHCN